MIMLFNLQVIMEINNKVIINKIHSYFDINIFQLYHNRKII